MKKALRIGMLTITLICILAVSVFTATAQQSGTCGNEGVMEAI